MDITIKTVALTCLLIALASGELDSENVKLLSGKCLNCLCIASSGCDKTPYFDGNVCGPYRITFGYWLDAGSPRTDLNSSLPIDIAFTKCANNLQCAERAIEGYIKRYQTDCTGDGKIDCDDFVRIHFKGPRSCSLPWNSWELKFKEAYEKCIKKL